MSAKHDSAAQDSTAQQGSFCADCGALVRQPETMPKPLRFCERCGQPQYSEPHSNASSLAAKDSPASDNAASDKGRFRRNLILAAVITLGLGGTSFGVTRLFIEKPQAADPHQNAQSGGNAAAAQPVAQELIDAATRLQDSASHAPDDKNLALRAANALYDLASAYQQQNAVFLAKVTFAKAEKLYEGYLLFDPKNTSARVDYAYTLVSQGKNDEGIVQTKKALEYEPNHPIALFNLGIIYARLQQYDEARKWLQQAQKAAPDSEIYRQSERLMKGFPAKSGS